MRSVLTVFVLALVLLGGACTPAGNSTPQGDGGVAADSIANVLEWDHAPDAVVVRLDTKGSTGDPVYDNNTLPYCTLFGDGHVMWVDPFADPEQVLEDRVSEQIVRGFLEYVIGTGFYTWDPVTGLLLPATTEPDNPGPIVEQITVTLYGQTVAQSALSNWPRETFANILDRCQHLSDSPALYQPSGGWLSAVPSEMRSDIPSLPWESFAENFPNVDITTMTLDAPVWATGDLLRVAWELVREGRVQITRDNVAYRLVVQVPGLQPAAPPAPAESTSGS